MFYVVLVFYYIYYKSWMTYLTMYNITSFLYKVIWYISLTYFSPVFLYRSQTVPGSNPSSHTSFVLLELKKREKKITFVQLHVILKCELRVHKKNILHTYFWYWLKQYKMYSLVIFMKYFLKENKSTGFCVV